MLSLNKMSSLFEDQTINMYLNRFLTNCQVKIIVRWLVFDIHKCVYVCVGAQVGMYAVAGENKGLE